MSVCRAKCVLLLSVGFLTCQILSSRALSLDNGQVAPPTKLDGKLGGRLDGKPWSSLELKDKVTLLFYVDPDEATANDHVTAAVRALNIPPTKLASVAIINMAGAKWTPNFAIESKLNDKQKEFPHTTYVKDFQKKLVKDWQLKDDSNDVVLFDKNGVVLFYGSGPLSKDQLAHLINLIRAH